MIEYSRQAAEQKCLLSLTRGLRVSRLFQDELNYLKDAGREYARLNPKLEKYLGVSASDPDIGRLMEGFAFLTSRLREKIEDELPEITHGILDTLWPQFLRPFPPTAMLKFLPMDKAITARHVVPRGTGMVAEAEDGTGIPFRTTADVTVYPLDIADISIERSRERSLLTLEFATLSGLPLTDIGLDTLRLTFCGDAAAELYAWSLTRAKRIFIRTASDEEYALSPEQVVAGGLGLDEALVDEPSPLLGGYRLLQEYFLVPEKFTCLDLIGLGAVFDALRGSAFSLSFEYEGVFPPDVKVENDAVRLYCCPVMNLFPHKAQAVEAGNGRLQPLLPHIPPGVVNYTLPEIYAVEQVTGSSGQVYPPYESFEHAIETAKSRRTVYFRHVREPIFQGFRWEHKIAFVDHAGASVMPMETLIEPRLLCFNGDKASTLPLDAIRHGAHDTPSFVTFTNITVPSRPVYPPLDDAVLWQFVSNLSPHHFMLRDRAAFANFITVYDYIAAQNRVAERSAKRRAQGIRAIDSKPIDWFFRGRPVRGLRSVITLSQKGFSCEGELYLFATVLSEFLGIFATENSFHKLEVVIAETNRRFQWNARRGRQPLI